MKSKAFGVCVVRLQVPELHAGHRYLLNTITAIHENVLVIIGETEARLTPNDPLTFDMRAQMLRSNYPNVQIMALRDQPDDFFWSQTLDKLIGEVMYLTAKMEPCPVLYGGRDSFLKHYHGGFRTFELPPIEPISGTEIRESVEVKHSEDFRRGMIFASKHRYPTSYQCVDVAIFDSGLNVLLGQKKGDNGKWRFIGGFVSPQDATLEAAVRREAREETGIEPGDPVYLGSAQINDFRYPKDGSDRLMSAFFKMNIVFGPARASDDIDAVLWVPFKQLADFLIPEHMPLLDILTGEINA